MKNKFQNASLNLTYEFEDGKIINPIKRKRVKKVISEKIIPRNGKERTN
jgi:hypothetical protein